MEASEIKQRIEHDFCNIAAVDAQHILVCVDQDIVTLKGRVGTWAEYDQAELVALGAPGVRGVRNLLGISP
jgi:osmotically-inducible protein OsmY